MKYRVANAAIAATSVWLAAGPANLTIILMANAARTLPAPAEKDEKSCQ